MAETRQQQPIPTLEDLPTPVGEALAALDEHKAQNTVVLDMRTVSGFTDFMIVTTGRSEPHVMALVEAVAERLAASSIKARHIEGRPPASWVLLDYLDLVVHVFTPEARQFYQLEKLWRDAPLLEWHEDSEPSE